MDNGLVDFWMIWNVGLVLDIGWLDWMIRDLNGLDNLD